MNNDYKICSRRIMDTTADEIEFDIKNIWNFVMISKKLIQKNIKILENFVNKIKTSKK